MSVIETRETNQSRTGDFRQGDTETALAMKIILVVLGLLVAWGLSVFFWGIPGLYIPALATVPIIYLVLVIVAKG